MSLQFANRLAQVETSAIRELFKLLGKPGIISFAGGFPDVSLCDQAGIAQAVNAALADDAASALAYGSTEGHLPLREQLAAFMQAKGCADVRADQVMVTTGSQQGMDLLAKCMISPGDKVIVEAPTFLAAIQCFRLYGAEVIAAPIDSDGVQIEALERLVDEHKPKLVYLIPTFGNPSGATLTLERRKRVLEMAARTQTLVVEDDPYGDLYFDAPPPLSMLALSGQVPESRAYLAHCGSLSKVLSAGLRLGWLIAPPALMSAAVMCKQFSDANTSTFAQATAAQYLAAGRMPETLARVRSVYAARAQAMCSSLSEALGAAMEFAAPQGGLFVWARLTGASGALDDAHEWNRRCVEKGVAFVPGAPFFANQPDKATLRLSFATADVEKIQEGVGRMAASLFL